MIAPDAMDECPSWLCCLTCSSSCQKFRPERGSLRQSWSWSLGIVVFAEGNSSAKLPPPHFLPTSSLQLVRVAVANLPSTSVQAMPLLLAISRLVPVTSEPILTPLGDKMLPLYSCYRSMQSSEAARWGSSRLSERGLPEHLLCPSKPLFLRLHCSTSLASVLSILATVTFPFPEPVCPILLQGFPLPWQPHSSLIP